MNPSFSRVPSARRRRMHYVDRSVQRLLLVAMVALEVVLVVASTWLLYWQLNELIEESLYRVHLADASPALTQLMAEAFVVLGVFAAVNVVALLLAEGIWRRHENLVIREFAALIDKTRRLDFSGDSETHRRHEVLEKALAWRAGERARFVAIREHLAKLEVVAATGKNTQDVRSALQDLSTLLWPRATLTGASAGSSTESISR